MGSCSRECRTTDSAVASHRFHSELISLSPTRTSREVLRIPAADLWWAASSSTQASGAILFTLAGFVSVLSDDFSFQSGFKRAAETFSDSDSTNRNTRDHQHGYFIILVGLPVIQPFAPVGLNTSLTVPAPARVTPAIDPKDCSLGARQTGLLSTSCITSSSCELLG